MDEEITSFRAIFTTTYPKVLAYARRRTSAAVADDVVAETYLVAWRRRAELAALDNPLPWLYRVAGNQLRNANRSTVRQLRVVERIATEPATNGGPGASPTVEPDGHDVDLLRAALGDLSEDDQEVLRLVTWEELTHQEAADVLDCSVDAVSQRVHRARKRLARSLEQRRSDDSTPDVDHPDSNTDHNPHSRGALT